MYKYYYFVGYLAKDKNNAMVRGNCTFKHNKKINTQTQIDGLALKISVVGKMTELAIMSITLLDKKLW